MADEPELFDDFRDMLAELSSAKAEFVVVGGHAVAAHGVSSADFAKPDTVYQLGLPPRRIDILTSIDGVSFDQACEEKIEVSMKGLVFPVIGRKALLANKRASGRNKDLGDVDALEGR